MFALVPLKTPSEAKSRLNDRLGAQTRIALSHAMADGVLEALTSAQEITQVFVITSDVELAQLAQKKNCHVVKDPGQGLNAAVTAGVKQARHFGDEPCLILHGDLPMIAPQDVDGLIRAFARQREVVGYQSIGLVPCKGDQGTNALILHPQTEFSFHYGENSFALHMAEADDRQLTPIILHGPAIAFDLDDDNDLDHVIKQISDGDMDKSHPIAKILYDHNLVSEDPSRLTGTDPRKLTRGHRLTYNEARIWGESLPLEQLMMIASELRDRGHGEIVTYSRKVFLPLTHLCRDVCHYCTFAMRPSQLSEMFMAPDKAIAIAREGAALGCKEALLTLGELPEARYQAARDALTAMGFDSTLDYVAAVAKAVHEATGLLPHINAGCMTDGEMESLRDVSASMGLMLESASPRLCEKGGAHYGSPDKDPYVRLETLARAGRLNVPMTTGLLIGIGETREERLQSLFALSDLHETYGHIQELIIQNFVPKSDTKMSAAPAAPSEDLLWTIAMARLIFGSEMSLQAPPNLTHGDLTPLIEAGINDWGGVSPLTPDYVNPESPWPHIDDLARQTKTAGKCLQERLTVYPNFINEAWLSPIMKTATLRHADGAGLARQDEWLTGQSDKIPQGFSSAILSTTPPSRLPGPAQDIVDELLDHGPAHLSKDDIALLFDLRGDSFAALCKIADGQRQSQAGDTITYAVNRNINYTNICTYRCQFCAFSKGRRREGAADKPYLMAYDEIATRALEAQKKGATEVCLQGGIHPSFTGDTYLEICRAIRAVAPDIHIHAFSPLEVWHGAHSLGLHLDEFLTELKKAGLNSLPGTAAEILDDDVRAILCPDKINTQQWMEVIETAHHVGLHSTSTIMFGHVDGYDHWGTHLLRLHALQNRTGGITEFVPLPFVAEEAPIYKKGLARKGPTLREAVLMHGIARLVLGHTIPNIQTSWVKMGKEGAALCLQSGANDLGGTLMNESITRAAGATHGQEWSAEKMRDLARSIGRSARQRTTFYEHIETIEREFA